MTVGVGSAPAAGAWLRRSRPVVGRLASAAITLLGLAALTFVVGRILPMDPVLAIVGNDADQAVYEAAYKRLGLDRPLYEQVLRYLWDLVQFDFGQSYLTKRPVSEDLLRVIPATIELGVLATLVGAVIGTVLGVIAGVRVDQWPDRIIRLVSLLAYSTPVFWTALMALVVFYAGLGWAPGPGRIDLTYIDAVPHRSGFILIDTLWAGNLEAFGNALAHLVMPLSILSVLNAAWYIRFCRTFTLEQLNQEYVMAARVKGVPEYRVVWGHIFPNILVQLITITAVALGGSLEGAVLIETLFSWPGFGSYFVQALVKGDMNAVVGATVVTGLLFIGFNLIAESLYRVADPRTR